MGGMKNIRPCHGMKAARGWLLMLMSTAVGMAPLRPLGAAGRGMLEPGEIESVGPELYASGSAQEVCEYNRAQNRRAASGMSRDPARERKPWRVRSRLIRGSTWGPS